MSAPARSLAWVGVAAALLLAAPEGRGASPRAWAEPITAENVERLQVGGSDAIGGVGDWALGNGVLCAVVSSPAHESHLSAGGGALVDLGRCGLAHDQWITQEPLLNMSRDEMIGAESVRAEHGPNEGDVALVVASRKHDVDVETRYRLAADRPAVLEVETRIRRSPDRPRGPRAFLFGNVILHGRRQLARFTLQLDADDRPARGARGAPGEGRVGFVHPPVDPDDILTMVAAILPANFHVLVGGDRQSPGVAYGVLTRSAVVRDRAGGDRPIPSLSVGGESFTMQGVFPRPFWVGGEGIGWIELAQSALMDLELGETLVVRREIRVGARSDVASVTDQLWSRHPRLRGRVEPGARLHLDDEDGAPVTMARPDASGAFAFHAPPGRYRLRVRGPAGREETLPVSLASGTLDLGDVALPASGRVVLPRGRPLRLVFVREPEGEVVHFDDDLLGFRIGDRSFRGSDWGPGVALAGVEADPESVQLAPGRYTVLATRGPTHDLARATVDVAPGVPTALVVDEPVRVHDHPGWVAADLHVHSEWSDDSTFPVERQIAAFTAESAHLLVSTEHDRVADYGPVIRRLGLQDRIASLVGAEVTSSAHTPSAPRTAGHSNLFPLALDPAAYRGGVPRSEGRRLRDVVAEARARSRQTLVQLNHPRGRRDSDLNLFAHLSVAGEPFRPATALASAPNAHLLEASPDHGLRDLDFDLFELWNGDSVPKLRAARADWYSLMLQGEYRPGVANSDSHVHGERVAYPRTFVRVPGFDGSPATLDRDAFLAALRAGRAYGSSGPLLEVALVAADGSRAGLGETLAARAATLELEVRSAPWVPVSRLRVLSNGHVVHEGPVRAGRPERVALRFERDAFVTLEVRGEASEDYARVAPGFHPFAFTNPVFVDADGDDRITPPGLASPPPVLDPSALD